MTDTFSPPELPLAPDKSLEVIMRNLSAVWPRMLWMICSPNKRQQVLRQASFFPPKINVSSDCFVSQTQKKFLLSTESTNTTLLACGRVWTMLESSQSPEINMISSRKWAGTSRDWLPSPLSICGNISTSVPECLLYRDTAGQPGLAGQAGQSRNLISNRFLIWSWVAGFFP